MQDIQDYTVEELRDQLGEAAYCNDDDCWCQRRASEARSELEERGEDPWA